MRLATMAVLTVLVGMATLGACLPDQGKDPEGDPPGEAGALAHAACMREHGFDWPDPRFIDGEWETHYEGIDLESSAYKEAEVECQKARDRAQPHNGSVDDPEQRARAEAELEAMLRFAACMRSEGIEFPDPVMDDSGVISGPAGPLDGDQDAFDAAKRTCEERIDAPTP